MGQLKIMLNFTSNLLSVCERSKASLLNSYMKTVFIMKSEWLSCKKKTKKQKRISERVENKLTVFVKKKVDLRGKCTTSLNSKYMTFKIFAHCCIACNFVCPKSLSVQWKPVPLFIGPEACVQTHSNANRKMNQGLWSPAEAPGVTGNSPTRPALCETSPAVWEMLLILYPQLEGQSEKHLAASETPWAKIVSLDTLTLRSLTIFLFIYNKKKKLLYLHYHLNVWGQYDLFLQKLILLPSMAAFNWSKQ